MSIKSLICEEKPCNCTGKPATDKAGWKGDFYGWIEINGRKWAIIKWAIIKWEGDDDPDLYKANCLLIETSSMVSID